MLAVLFLRGAQTPGELKQRTDRMQGFPDLPSLQAALDRLVERDFALRLARRPGQKEERYVHRFSEEAEGAPPVEEAPEPLVAAPPRPRRRRRAPPRGRRRARRAARGRARALRDEVAVAARRAGRRCATSWGPRGAPRRSSTVRACSKSCGAEGAGVRRVCVVTVAAVAAVLAVGRSGERRAADAVHGGQGGEAQRARRVGAPRRRHEHHRAVRRLARPLRHPLRDHHGHARRGRRQRRRLRDRPRPRAPARERGPRRALPVGHGRHLQPRPDRLLLQHERAADPDVLGPGGLDAASGSRGSSA